MYKTIIIGKNSNLSKNIFKNLSNSVLISSREIQENIDILSSYRNEKINIIFNNFQTSTKLNNLNSSQEYIENSILITSKILDYFKNSNINKIIYTSSSSVYGNNIHCSEKDELKPMNLHASLKVANEKLVEKFCIDHDIDYTITRIFNMYGEDDSFSIISKIINSVKNKSNLTIVNNGNAIRDFIHINDVVEIYIKIIDMKNIPIINIGTGNGSSIKNIIDFLYNNNIILDIESIVRTELKTSTSDSYLLQSIIEKKEFIKVENYLKKELML